MCICTSWFCIEQQQTSALSNSTIFDDKKSAFLWLSSWFFRVPTAQWTWDTFLYIPSMKGLMGFSDHIYIFFFGHIYFTYDRDCGHCLLQLEWWDETETHLITKVGNRSHQFTLSSSWPLCGTLAPIEANNIIQKVPRCGKTLGIFLWSYQ